MSPKIRKTLVFGLGGVFLSSFLLSVVYASLSNVNLTVRGEATLLPEEKPVEIVEAAVFDSNLSNLELTEVIQTNGTMFQSKVALEASAEAFVEFKLRFLNNTENEREFSGVVVNPNFYDNDLIQFSLSGLQAGDKLRGEEVCEATIRFSYIEDFAPSSETELNSFLNFRFIEPETVGETDAIRGTVDED